MTEQVITVPLADIEIPEGWNARSGAWHENPADPSTDDGGFEGLKASMQAKGRNDTPVLLRYRSPPLPSDTQIRRKEIVRRASQPEPLYILVDGFRRMRAARELQWPTIRAIVEEMTDFEARRRNIQAQTSHERLKPADLAWAIADLKRLGGPKLTDEELGAVVGISGNYAGLLRRIMQDVDERVTGAWRAAAVSVAPVELQRLTVMPREHHWSKWEELLLDRQTRPHGRTKATAFLRLEEKARELGRTIGTLERLGVIPDMSSDGPDLHLAFPFLTNRELTDVERKDLTKAITDGYQEGLSRKTKP